MALFMQISLYDGRPKTELEQACTIFTKIVREMCPNKALETSWPCFCALYLAPSIVRTRYSSTARASSG